MSGNAPFELDGSEGTGSDGPYIGLRVVYAVLNVTAFVLLNLRIQLSPPSELLIVRAVLRSAWLAALLNCGVLYDPLGFYGGDSVVKIVSSVANGCILSGIIFHIGGCQLASEVRYARGPGKAVEGFILTCLFVVLWVLVLLLPAKHIIDRSDDDLFGQVELYGFSSVGTGCALMYAAAMRHNISFAWAAAKSFHNPVDAEFRTLARRRARRLVRQVVGVLTLMLGGVVYLLSQKLFKLAHPKANDKTLLTLLRHKRFVFLFVQVLVCYMWLFVYGFRPKARSAGAEDEDAALLLKRVQNEINGEEEDSDDEGLPADAIPDDSSTEASSTTGASEGGRGREGRKGARWAVRTSSHASAEVG